MAQHYILTVWLMAVLGAVVQTEGLFWSARKPTSNERSQQHQNLPPSYLYRGEATPWTPQYTYDSAVPPMTVALPVAVQMSQYGGGIKNLPPTVQLVPCLCPITRDPEPQYVQQQQQQQQQQPQQTAGFVVQQAAQTSA